MAVSQVVASSQVQSSLGLDIRAIGENVATHLVKDCVGPNRVEQIECACCQQEIAKDNRVQHAGVENVQLLTAQ